MADAYVIFRKRLPFAVTLNGCRWHVSLQTGPKTGYYALVAAAQGKFYIITAGKEHDVEQEMHCGIKISSGTPQRGLVTAMWRAGVVILLAARLPPVDKSW